MTIKFTNNATTSLASGINSSVTSLTVASGAGALFPSLSGSDVFYVTLANLTGTVEIVKVTARSSDTLTIVRAQDNTTAAAWLTGDKVELRPTAGILNTFVQQDPTTPSTFGFKNRIINGAMTLDQRNAGASITFNDGVFVVDRYGAACSQASKATAQRSTTAPAGFTNSVLITSSSAYSVTSTDFFNIFQNIEGFNVADLGWGTASAQTVTLSFWVRSSLTGTFGGSLSNGSLNRSYPFTYTISAANTFEYKTITIAGDTSGTWATDNSLGIRVYLGLGVGTTYSGTAGAWAGTRYHSATGATSVVGTSGATFYITGVQLEKGSTATSFDVRFYGTEVALCQRYYYRITAQAAGDYFVPNAYAIATTAAFGYNQFPVPMRTRPTALEQSGTATDYNVVRCGLGTNTNCSAVPSFGVADLVSAQTIFTVTTGLLNSGAGSVQANNTNAYLGWSAEL